MRKIYRKLIQFIKNMVVFINTLKNKIDETFAIIKKRRLYKDIKWTQDQINEFNTFWETNYGKRIKPYWHKYYQKYSGVFNVKYIPEKIFSTIIEPKWNPYFQAKEYENKSLVELLVGGDGGSFRCPQTYIVVDNGIFYDENRKPISKEEAHRILKQVETAVLKPTKGSSSGRNLSFWERDKYTNVNIDHEIDELFNQYDGNFIIQEKIIPSKKLSLLYPNAINTFRVCTYTVNGKVYNSPISLRIGGSGSKVDNIHAGGMVVGVDNEGNLLSTAYKIGYGFEDRRFESHPDTNAIFKEQKIEEVKDIVRFAKELHGKYIGLRMVSWDFTLDVNNMPVILEANLCGQSVWFPQMISGREMFGEQTEAVLNEFKK